MNSSRIAVVGASAGGQMAAATATIDSEKINDELFPGVSCIPNAVILCNPWFRCPDALSPPKHVREELPPIIMFIGDKDPVPYDRPGMLPPRVIRDLPARGFESRPPSSRRCPVPGRLLDPIP